MRFLLDAMLGKLVRYLRMMGYDTVYVDGFDEEPDDEEIIRRANSENRVVVTRDRELASRSSESILIESLEIEDQLRELNEKGVRISLGEPERCSVCNGELILANQKPKHAPDSVEDIWVCEECGKHYWKGSHWDDVEDTLGKI